ncbi:MAG: hypothetical protein V1838_04750 [Patescibacteria group bacterium]
MKKRSVLFIIIFAIIGLLALQVPFNQIVGSDTRFTLFDFFGPLATGFIGLVPGIIAIFFMQLGNFIIHGALVIDAGTIIRFFPMLFAAWYFARKSSFNIIIPLLAMAAFIIHPIGRTAWVYSLYWLVPVICYFFRERWLLARALGTTFTAHAVGSVLFLWVFALPKAVWLSLIPLVAFERMLFASGIVVMYVVMNNVLNYLVKREIVKWHLLVDPRYVENYSK